MAYSSQNEAQHYRMLHKAQKLHHQLGGDGVLDGNPLKPKGMHWRTYNRKIAAMNRANNISWAKAVIQYQLLSGNELQNGGTEWLNGLLGR